MTFSECKLLIAMCSRLSLTEQEHKTTSKFCFFVRLINNSANHEHSGHQLSVALVQYQRYIFYKVSCKAFKHILLLNFSSMTIQSMQNNNNYYYYWFFSLFFFFFVIVCSFGLKQATRELAVHSVPIKTSHLFIWLSLGASCRRIFVLTTHSPKRKALKLLIDIFF